MNFPSVGGSEEVVLGIGRRNTPLVEVFGIGKQINFTVPMVNLGHNTNPPKVSSGRTAEVAAHAYALLLILWFARGGIWVGSAGIPGV